MFAGDSITQMWDQPDSGATSVFALYSWFDVGVSGYTSGQILGELQANLTNQMTGVHIIAGTNDVYPGWQLSDTTPNIQSMVSLARQNHSLIALGTIPPWGPGDLAEQADPSQERFERIDELNDWIVQYGAEHNIPVVDYHAALVAKNGENYADGLSSDGVHPNAAGYAVMTPLAEKALSKMLTGSKATVADTHERYRRYKDCSTETLKPAE